jgi:hypothetical protein
MAFQTGSLSTLSNIIDTLDTFAVANGYTNNQKYTNGNWYILSLTKNSLVYNIAVDTVNNLLELQIPTSHTASTAWGSDPAANINEPQANALTGLSGYDFFANGTNIRAVIKLNDGRYKNFAFGETLRPGFSGYAFCGATYWTETVNSSSWIPASISNNMLMNGVGSPTKSCAVRVAGTLYYQDSSKTMMSYGWAGPKEIVLLRTPSASNLRATAVQKLLGITNGLVAPSLRYAPIGYIEGMVDISLTLLTAEDVVDTDWVVYPYIKKDIGQTTNGEVSSQEYGFAFKK